MAEEETSQPPAEPTAPVEPAIAPEAAPAEPEATPSEPETQTAQMGRSEPLPTPSEPLPDQQPASQPSAPTQVTAPIAHRGRDVLTKARATIQDRKHKKLEKIMEALNTKGKITNDEVEKLLHVSDATATRYLSALEREGKIQQVGKTGKAVEYTRI